MARLMKLGYAKKSYLKVTRRFGGKSIAIKSPIRKSKLACSQTMVKGRYITYKGKGLVQRHNTLYDADMAARKNKTFVDVEFKIKKGKLKGVIATKSIRDYR